MKKLIDTVKKIYHKTPKRAQFIYWPLKFIDKHINKLRYDIWILRGEESLSKQQMGIIYAYNGGSKENMNLLIKLAFGRSYEEHYLGKLWLWKIDRTVKEKGCECSLMVLEAPESLRRLLMKNCFYIPGWIFGEVDISDDSSLFKNSSLQSDLRRIRKNRLHFEVRNEIDQLYNFYHNMYVPYISKAHDNRAIITDYDFLVHEFRKCDLLLIKKDQIYIAGCLISHKGNEPRLWSLGVKDANTAYINDGAIGALFYFAVKHLKGRGYNKVNFGLSRPFMNDGVLRYKKKWGLKIISADKIGFMIEPLSQTDGLCGFLLNNPFIFLEKQNFNGAIFVNNEHSFTGKDFERIYKDYYLPGMSHLNIYFNGVVNPGLLDAVPLELREIVKIYSAESFFKRKGRLFSDG